MLFVQLLFKEVNSMKKKMALLMAFAVIIEMLALPSAVFAKQAIEQVAGQAMNGEEDYTKYRNTIFKDMFNLMEETGAYLSEASARDFSKFGNRGQVQQANNLRSGMNSLSTWLEARLK